MTPSRRTIDIRGVLGLMAGGSGGPGAFHIPDPAAGFPTDKVDLRWVEGSQFSKAVIPSFLAGP